MLSFIKKFCMSFANSLQFSYIGVADFCNKYAAAVEVGYTDIAVLPWWIAM